MALSFETRLPGPLDSPTSRGQREAVPVHDQLPSPRNAVKRRFWRIFRLLALLSIVTATIAVILVGEGDPVLHINMIVATGLGVGVAVLLGTSLMTLVFLSAGTGHDDAAAEHTQCKEKE
jgi:hypothetical protein